MNNKAVGCVIIFLLLSFSVSAEDVPKFFGVYSVNKGIYTEIPRVKTNITTEGPMTSTTTILKDKFIEISASAFNKEGFIIVGEDISHEVIKIPTTQAPLIGNNFPKSKYIYTNHVSVSIFGSDVSASMIDGPKLKKAKIGKNTYMYLPKKPLLPGYYALDYMTLGKQPEDNWNVFKLTSNAVLKSNAEKIPLVSVFSNSRWKVINPNPNREPEVHYLRDDFKVGYFDNSFRKRMDFESQPATWSIDGNNLIVTWENGTSETYDASTPQYDFYTGIGQDGKKWEIKRIGL